ncbi:Crp/Fnr family transcriptional regulator [uncultured Algoriphagus sp.]|uniref:Crp/Fnr family transcriptional regulator n=1 Tax=uncultured Algoriphagus sp. TaxID=417365 RepID=UPI0030EC6978|tara:strand:+ start:10165 stop:10761 length:597 start_codon:yes stop_codon:yes gene_type:complete
MKKSIQYEGLLENIGQYVSLTEEETDKLIAIIRTTKIKKRQFIDQPNYVCQYRNYIVDGAFRSYFVDAEGKEHTIQIAVEDWFISDFCSYITQTPATLFVEALEDSTIFQMAYDDVEGLCKEIHALSEYFRIKTEIAFAFSRKRALSYLSLTAEERYLEFFNRYPNVVNRVPQKVIASYLGFTPEFLSKIRREIASKT